MENIWVLSIVGRLSTVQGVHYWRFHCSAIAVASRIHFMFLAISLTIFSIFVKSQAPCSTVAYWPL